MEEHLEGPPLISSKCTITKGAEQHVELCSVLCGRSWSKKGVWGRWKDIMKMSVTSDNCS